MSTQPPPANTGYRKMAQTHRAPAFPLSGFATEPEQHSPGPRLPPIHSIPIARSTYDSVDRPVHLPPLQIQHYGAQPPSRIAASRSIPVAELLSSGPSWPSNPSPTTSPLQNPHWHAQNHRHGYSSTDTPVSPMSYQQALPRRLDQSPYRQAPSRQSHAPPASYEQTPETAQRQFHTRSESHDQRLFSPVTSVLSSPSYSHSEQSPRSSIAPSSQCSAKTRKIQVPPFDFKLLIRQQPVAARACGFGERDRRVIDPPPILELKITDRITGAPEADSNAMLALHCTLLSPDGRDDETELPPAHPDMPSTRRLMGTLVASPYQAKDENSRAGVFFVFPDLSCRSPGKYRLRFKLLRIDPMNVTPGSISPSVASIVTDIFSVYTAKDFPGMRASSDLLKSLRRQGLNVGVKKGSESRKGKGKSQMAAGSTSSEDLGDHDSDAASSDDGSSKAKSRKKGKRRRHD